MIAQIMVICERRHNKSKVFGTPNLNFRNAISRQSDPNVRLFERIIFADTGLWGVAANFFALFVSLSCSLKSK